MGKYGVILADPPWQFSTYSEKGKGRSADRHYSTMTVGDIMSMREPHELAAKDCVLFLWVTQPFLPSGLLVMATWGFTYKTVGFTWVKTTGIRNPISPDAVHFPIGTGFWTRSNPELCLLGTKGSPKRKAKDVRELIVAPRRQHSRKPDEVYDRIERLVDGPYMEMFARQQWPGWDVMGDETDRFEVTK